MGGPMANLRNQLETWVLVRLLLTACDRLEAQHIGTKFGEALDRRFSPTDSRLLQTNVAKWLRQVAAEIDA